MLMKNFFVIHTFLLLALAGLGSSAPQKRGPALPTLGLEDVATGLATVNADAPLAALSKPCQDAINKNVINTPLMKCLPIDAIFKLMADPSLIGKLAKDPLHVIAQPEIKTIFDDACSVAQCKDADVKAAATAVLGGCGADIGQKVVLAELIFAGLVIYTPAIDIVCFKDQAAEYCLIETDKILLSLPPPQVTIPGLEKSPLIESVALAAPIYICTPCNKAIINTFFDYYNDPANTLFTAVLSTLKYDAKVHKTVNLAVDVKCGITPFNDGKVGDPSKGPDPPAIS